MNKFEKAYQIVDFDLGCPKGCTVCEENTSHCFLPGEIEFLSKKIDLPKERMGAMAKSGNNSFWLCGADKECMFYKSGKCAKRCARPLDCRTYPANLVFEEGKMIIKLDSTCPLVKGNKIPKEFVENSLKAWKLVNPPEWWMKQYSKIE